MSDANHIKQAGLTKAFFSRLCIWMSRQFLESLPEVRLKGWILLFLFVSCLKLSKGILRTEEVRIRCGSQIDGKEGSSVSS